VADFGELAFQLADLERSIEKLAPQDGRLLLELFDVHLQFADFLLECGDPAIELRRPAHISRPFLHASTGYEPSHPLQV
jgi:hypothetical protein